MDINSVLLAHGIGGSSRGTGGSSIALPSVDDLTLSQNASGTQISLSWVNPVDPSFTRSEVYVAKNDISSYKYNKISEVATKIYSGTEESMTYETTPNETYYFKVFTIYSVFGVPTPDEGAGRSLKAIDTKPPANVTDISAVEDETFIKLSWTNPVDTDLTKVRVVRSANTIQDENDGEIVYEGLATTFTMNELPQDTTYQFRFFAYDTSGNINHDESMQITAATVSVGSVTDVNLTQTDDGEKMTLTWTNPIDATFNNIEVYVATIDLSAKSYAQVVEDATKIYDGTDTNIDHDTVPNTTYFFKIYAKHTLNDNIKIDKGISKYLKAVDTVAPAQVSNLTAQEDDKRVVLSWNNPTDTDFSKVTIAYKTSDFPTSKTDGTIVYSGSNTTITVDSLTNDTKYYFSVFSEDTNGNVSVGKQISATPADVKIYGVKIDTNNSNPETALTYTDNAIGFTPAKMNGATFDYGSWENVYPFNQIKPCVVKSGVVNYYLNPNDYSKKVDGTTADITSGNDGDVMVEFPKIWWKFETVGTDIYIRYATKQKDATYKCLAHMRGTTEKDKVYVSAYLGTNISSKLRSLSGKTPTGSQTIGAFRTLAQANGSGYDQMAYYQLLMLQVLYIVMFKDRDSQTALGRGYVDGNSAATTTGQLNTKGLFYGETTGKVQVKFCGVEDFYGNMFYWIDGFFSDTNRNMLIGNQSFNDTGSGYTNYGQGATANLSGYLSDIKGGTETGFVAKATSGSATTHYADYANLYASCLPYFGGTWADASNAGAFYLRVNNSASSSYSTVGSRLLFC